ncbi:MAG: GNAT family N-acetyltransferase [Phycisphaerae bacterium]|nr:GNAT family N-acetyltransferase [Phycisphaerae bacterium]
MSEWRIELLDKCHERDAFDCGEESLNAFLVTHAGQNARRDISRTYVAVPRESDAVAGYYTLSSGSVACRDLPDELAKRLPKYPVPIAHLGRLAVDKRFQGQGLGGILLVDALMRVGELADRIGIHAVTVYALNAKARHFYEAYGFLSLPDDGLHPFLPMATIRRL